MEKIYRNLANVLIKIEKDIERYRELINGLPKGSIFVRNVNNKKYVYRNRKIDGKVKCEYLGRFTDDRVREEIKKSHQYKTYVAKIRMLTKQKKNIAKIFNNNGELARFAVALNKVDGKEPSPKAKVLLNLLENQLIDLKTYEETINKIYKLQKIETGSLVEFAIAINSIDGVRPDKKAITILNLYEKGKLTLKQAEILLNELDYEK